MNTQFEIRDWAGNLKFGGQLFRTFDDAEAYLSEALGDRYETDRGEFYVIDRLLMWGVS